MSDPENNPGSEEAVASGCSCPRRENRYGRGIPGRERLTFHASGECVLHGFEATGQLDEEGNLLPEDE